MKFEFVPENILILLDRGGLTVEITPEELAEFEAIEKQYFDMQYKLKLRAKADAGIRYFSDGRD